MKEKEELMKMTKAEIIEKAMVSQISGGSNNCTAGQCEYGGCTNGCDGNCWSDCFVPEPIFCVTRSA